MFWNLNDTPVVVYNAGEELVDLSAAGNFPKTQAQIVNIGVEIIHKTQDFETGPRKWFDSTAVEHMWQIFKSHFTDNHDSLKRILGPTMCNAAYHQANQMADELNTNVKG